MIDSGEENDIVLDILARVREEFPEISEERALEIERGIRRDWGGERLHIAKDMKRRPHERKRIRDKVKKHGVAKTMKEERGISRATLYRMLAEDDAD